MTTQVAMSFGALRCGDDTSLERTVRLVPALSAGLMQSCDVAVRAWSRSLLLRVRLADGAAVPGVVERLAFWSARADGTAVALPGGLGAATTSVDSALERSDLLQRDVAPDAVPGALDRAFAALWPASPRAEPDPAPVLALVSKGRRRDSIRYDAGKRLLSVVTPLALPAGDRFVLTVPRGEGAARGQVRVVGVRRTRSRPGGDGGAVLLLAVEGKALHAELARTAALARETCGERRHVAVDRWVRFAYARGPESGSVEEVAILRDVSLAGAHLGTRHPAPVGSLVLVSLRLPVVGERSLKGVVESVWSRGMSVRFELDTFDEAALAAGAAALALRSAHAGLDHGSRMAWRAEAAAPPGTPARASA